MQIITGSAKGCQIKVPEKDIRPAKDSVRQAVFSMLYGLVGGAKALNLFAGSGSYGLEALSQGAKSTTFVDIDKKCVAAIEANLNTMSFGGRGVVVREDAQKYAHRTEDAFDLIFLDPPYSSGAQVHLLKTLAKILTPQGVVIFDHAKETKIPEEIDGLSLLRQRTYGATTVSLLTHPRNPLAASG